jgi:hypothetical protein
MKIKASGRSALMLATGLFVGFAGPSHAAPGADHADYTVATTKSENTAGPPIALNKSAQPGSRHWKSHAHLKSSKVALKSSTGNNGAAADAADNDGDSPIAIPPSVANANAQLASADTPADKVKAMSARANEILRNAPDDAQPAAESQVVSADQLNDVDRALHEATPTLTMAAADVPAAPAASVNAASSSESSAWDQTSLIGKIFIGFGALLTMASAVRMFMA